MSVMNIVELFADGDEQSVSPCKNGNIVAGHACYCHAEDSQAPRKCPVWRNYGEEDLTKWHTNGDFNKDDWGGGCQWFEPK
jgi:hypothetical protein